MAVVRFLPFIVVDWLGTLLGFAFYLFDRVHRRTAERNVAAAFPSRDPAERRRIVRSMFGHFGRLLFQVLKFSTLSPEAMLERVEFEGQQRAEHAYAHGKGVLF